MQLKTTGDLRSFLADVLVGIRDGSIDANQANSISKVAAQINQSLSTEVQARINLKELGGEAGAMVIASDHVRDEPKMVEQRTEPPKIITQDIPKADPIDPGKVKPIAVKSHRDGDKLWCDQCEMRVTTSQAIGCKSNFCKAKEAA